MPEPPPTPLRPWLLAAWPGMGNVAVIAAGYLIKQLALRPFAEVHAPEQFDIGQVDVLSGIIEQTRLPRSVFYRTPEGAAGRPLIVFLGEAQPTHGGYMFAQRLLERAAAFEIERVITFASMASQVHPTDEPAVHAAATSPQLLEELVAHGAHPVEGGQIGGLNGVLLAAAMERNLPGMCLLGEIPFYAANVPNPKAARAVLDSFSELAGVSIDMAELTEHGRIVEGALLKMLDRMQKMTEGEDEEESEFAVADAAEEPAAPAEPPPKKRLDAAARKRIEQLFEDAQADRRLAMDLKAELDRYGVFKDYEDRFLDLFKRAE